jgi:hypothetical protein
MSNTVDWSVSIAGECMVTRPFSMHAEDEFRAVRRRRGRGLVVGDNGRRRPAVAAVCADDSLGAQPLAAPPGPGCSPRPSRRSWAETLSIVEQIPGEMARTNVLKELAPVLPERGLAMLLDRTSTEDLLGKVAPYLSLELVRRAVPAARRTAGFEI